MEDCIKCQEIRAYRPRYHCQCEAQQLIDDDTTRAQHRTQNWVVEDRLKPSRTNLTLELLEQCWISPMHQDFDHPDHPFPVDFSQWRLPFWRSCLCWSLYRVRVAEFSRMDARGVRGRGTFPLRPQHISSSSIPRALKAPRSEQTTTRLEFSIECRLLP